MNRSLFSILSALAWILQCLCHIPVQGEESPSPSHILYLAKAQQTKRALALYQELSTKRASHDPQLLRSLATILLEEGAQSEDAESQLLSIFGASLAGICAPTHVLKAGIDSRFPHVQLAAVHYLGQMQDDHSEQLLSQAITSEFLRTRLDAAYFLALRRAKNAVGQIEALMHRLPPYLRTLFPNFFALIGTPEAIRLLKLLMEDGNAPVRIEAILCAAHCARDDLAPLIRSRATHPHAKEQEACAIALGELRDTRSIPLLKKLATSPQAHVLLAANLSLYRMGVLEAAQPLMRLAKDNHPFAIQLLGEIEGSEETLLPLLSAEDLQIRFSATLALLKRRDPRCVQPLLSFLLKDPRDLGFVRQYSPGESLAIWRAVPSSQHRKSEYPEIEASSLDLREKLLHLCLELPEEGFLHIAKQIFDTRDSELVALTTFLLENAQSQGAIALLQSMAQATGAPLVRAYCDLALMRLHIDPIYAGKVREWVHANETKQMVRFRPLALQNTPSHFQLTPEEGSRLLVESLTAIALSHDKDAIDILLEAMQKGHAKNSYVLAALLLCALV